MKVRQKIASLVLAAVTAVSALGVTAFAADPVGTNPTILKDGVQATEQIKFDDSYDYDNGHNYTDFQYSAPAEGIMVLTFDAAINDIKVQVFKNDDKKEIQPKTRVSQTGGKDNKRYWMDANAGLLAATATYEVEKADYIIRVSRCFDIRFDGVVMNKSQGKEGNGRIHITAEMQKPDAPSSVKVSKKTENSFTLTWAEPEGVDCYDVRYKAKNDKKWKTEEDIEDNTVTIKGLKANTSYTYCIRSKAGEIIGEWSKAATVKTSSPANAKFTAPAVSSTITIKWKEVKDASGYDFQYSTDGKNWKNASVKDTSYGLSVASGKTYYYAVRAKNSAKKGPWSATKSITIG